MKTVSTKNRRPWVLAALLSLFALGLIGGGMKLVLLGGSSYYLISGLIVLGAGIQLWRGKASSLWLYSLFVLITFIWSIYEAGFDGWALAPRVCIPAGFGIWLAFPYISRWLRSSGGIIAGAKVCLVISIASLLLLLGSALKPNDEPGEFPQTVDTAVDARLIGPENGEWPHYGNTLAGTRFSPLTQINLENIDQLEPAWSYRTGVVQKGQKSHFQATPLMVNDTLYLCTQTNIVIALDPETGKERWRYDPEVDPTGGSVVRTCRGVAYAESESASECPQRIIAAAFDTRLFAVDANTGKLCQSFGNNGMVDLKRGMGKLDPGFSYMSSAPTVVRNNVVINGWIADNVMVGEPSGVIRAFDVITGEFAWAWDLGRPGKHGEPEEGEIYTRGTPNSWGPMSGDEELGMVYVPTGNATPDHWGGHRTAEMDKYSSSIVALNAETGEPQWHYQTVHHDLWDYDVASQPTLVDVQVDGKKVPALLQPTMSASVNARLAVLTDTVWLPRSFSKAPFMPIEATSPPPIVAELPGAGKGWRTPSMKLASKGTRSELVLSLMKIEVLKTMKGRLRLTE